MLAAKHGWSFLTTLLRHTFWNSICGYTPSFPIDAFGTVSAFAIRTTHIPHKSQDAIRTKSSPS